MKLKQLFLSTLLGTFLCSSFLSTEAGWTDWFNLGQYSSFESFNINDSLGTLNKVAVYIGYVTLVFGLEQSVEYCGHLYNKRYADHADKLKQAIEKSSLSKKQKLASNDEKDLLNRASEFSNPLYRYTLGLFKANPIERWLQHEIDQKKSNSNHIINQDNLNNLLIRGCW